MYYYRHIFCVIILAFYHPMFLVFDILLITCIVLAIFIPMRAGYEAGLKESSNIYDIVYWFEEKTSEFLSFRQRPEHSSVKKVDAKFCNYSDARANFFSVIFRQHVYLFDIYLY